MPLLIVICLNNFAIFFVAARTDKDLGMAVLTISFSFSTFENKPKPTNIG